MWYFRLCLNFSSQICKELQRKHQVEESRVKVKWWNPYKRATTPCVLFLVVEIKTWISSELFGRLEISRQVAGRTFNYKLYSFFVNACTELPTLLDSAEEFLIFREINQSGCTNLTTFLIVEMFCPLWGCCAPNQKLACFVLCLKIINTFLENNIWILGQEKRKPFFMGATDPDFLFGRGFFPPPC